MSSWLSAKFSEFVKPDFSLQISSEPAIYVSVQSQVNQINTLMDYLSSLI
jgi:hypothetical protein